MKKILLLGFVVLFLSGCEQQGFVSIDECFEKIIIEEDSFKTYFNTFTCTSHPSEIKNVYRKENCYLIDMEEGACRSVFAYEKEHICPENLYQKGGAVTDEELQAAINAGLTDDEIKKCIKPEKIDLSKFKK